jgi:hypothetical protein
MNKITLDTCTLDAASTAEYSYIERHHHFGIKASIAAERREGTSVWDAWRIV